MSLVQGVGGTVGHIFEYATTSACVSSCFRTLLKHVKVHVAVPNNPLIEHTTRLSWAKPYHSPSINHNFAPHTMTTPISPSSSPRLPSPPPIAEDQSGPTSPGLSLYSPRFPGGGAEASRRIRPGTKAEDMAEGPPVTELMDIDSAFQLTEHLKALHHSFTHPYDSITTTPITAELARQLAYPPQHTAKEIWLYELGRFLIQKTNAIIVALFSDSPACSAATCHEMRASEWQYLCAVHDPPKSCSAIDYCCHTLDWAASTLCNSKLFPSRLGLGSGSGAGMGGTAGTADKVLLQQMKEITNIFRRVYRIYAHAWFQHREVFWRVEGKTGLYVFFKTVCDEYGLIQTENYTIPPEAEGLEPKEVSRDTPVAAQPPAGMSLLRRPEESKAEQQQFPEPAGNDVMATGDTTKRHRNTTHNRSNSVATTIAEEAEEDEDFPSKPSLDRAPTVKKEGGLARSDTIKPQPSAEVETEAEAAYESTVFEEPAVESSKLVEAEAAASSKLEDKDAEDDEAEITVIEAEVPEDAEGPGESAAVIPEETTKAETVIEI
jgi:hypothetical protein